MLKENLPIEINNNFRSYLIHNFKELNHDKYFVKTLVEQHKNVESNAHTSAQITHEGQPLNVFMNRILGRVNNQIYSASRNSAAEIKDIRVDVDGGIHQLAQDRLMRDFDKIDSIASQADDLAQKHDTQIENSAYYDEIDYISARKFDTSYKIVTIPHRDSDGNLIKLRKGISGSDKSHPDHITARDFAKQTSATYVGNASTGSGSRLMLHGQQIYNGKILESITDYTELTKRWTLAVADDNTLTAFPPNVTAKEILAKGYNNTFSGFGPLIMDGKKVYSKGDYSVNSEESHPRQVIAQLPNKDIIVFSCDGRINSNALYQKGMTLTEVIDTLYSHYGEIQFAYNLDGGGSTSSVLRSRMLNKPTDNYSRTERNLLDFIYVGKDPRQVRDTDIQNAYADIGDLRSNFNFLYGLFLTWNEIQSNEVRLTQYNDYTGLVAMDGQEPKKKFYMNQDEFRFWDYDSAETWFRVNKDNIQYRNRALARNFSSPEQVMDCNNIKYGGKYAIPKDAKGSPYPNITSCVLDQSNMSAAEFTGKNGEIVLQWAYPLQRSSLRAKRRTFTDGEWSQWFDL